MGTLIVTLLVLVYFAAVVVVAGARRALIRMSARSDYQDYRGEPVLDDATLNELQEICNELEAAGFRGRGRVVERRAQRVSGVAELFDSPDESTTAAVLLATVGARLLRRPFVNLVSDLVDGGKLATTNAPFRPPIPFRSSDRVVRLATVRHASVIAKVHQARVSAAAGLVVSRCIGNEPAAFFSKAIDDDRRRDFQAGFLRQVDESSYGLQWLSALRTAARDLPPVAQFFALAERMNTKRIVESQRA